MQVGVTGGTGRMGSRVADLVGKKEELELAFVVDEEASSSNNQEVRPDSELRELIDERSPDLLVDFTLPKATLRYASICAETGVGLVTGTTGFDEDELREMKGFAEEIPVLKASNFSKGIQALRNAVEEAVGSLEGYDIEVVETHHNAKRDAPSGTAKSIISDILEARGGGREVHGREGEQPRSEGEVGVHAIRAGDIKGEHEVILAGNEEIIRLGHRVESRDVFALGALEAASWLEGREAGWYDFAEVVGGQS